MGIEECRVEASKYKNRKEFQTKARKFYLLSLKNDWLDIFYKKRDIKPKGYWTKERCIEEVLKYDSRHDLRVNSKAYPILVKNGWLHELCEHLPGHLPKGYWTKENCLKEALKYKSRVDFENGCISACITARNNDWIDEICGHMMPLGNLYSRCIYAIEFSDNHVYIGLTYNVKNRFNQHMNVNKESSVYRHMKKSGIVPTLKILSDFISCEEASKLEYIKMLEYSNNGWYILNKAKCGALGSNRLYWNKERVIEEFSKYETKEAFKKNASGAWSSAQRNGWLSELF